MITNLTDLPALLEVAKDTPGIKAVMVYTGNEPYQSMRFRFCIQIGGKDYCTDTWLTEMEAFAWIENGGAQDDQRA